MKGSMQQLRGSKEGGSSFLCLKRKRPSKKHACLVEGVSWRLACLTPLDPRQRIVRFLRGELQENPRKLRQDHEVLSFT